MEPQMEMPEEQGRGGDTVMAHLSLGELVIPRAFLDDPQVMEAMKALFDEAGANINQYIVGDPANSINPETGYPEFGFFKKIFKAIKKIAIPAALSYFGAPYLSSALGGGTIGGALAGGLTGAAGSAITGGNPLTGALTGGLTGYAGAGGFDGTGIGDILGKAPSIGQGPNLDGSAGYNIAGSGIKGAVADIIPSFGSGAIQGAGTGASTSAYGGSSIGNIIGGLSSVGAQDDAAEKLLEQQRLAQQQYEPFLNQSFDAGDFKADPGYQFRQQEGEQALARRQAASGGLFSGNALKEASVFNQGNADQAYNDAYNRWLSTQRQGVGAAQAVNGIYDNVGNIQAGNTLANSNTFNNTLSNILGGGNVGEDIDPLTGKPRKKVTA